MTVACKSMRLEFRKLALAIVLVSLSLGGLSSVAQAASCAKFGNVKSQNSNRPVTVTFVNKSGEYRAVMWVDFNGRLVDYAGLNPGERFRIDTYVTHPWVFTDGPGNCVEMFMPRKNVRTFNLTRRATGQGGD